MDRSKILGLLSLLVLLAIAAFVAFHDASAPSPNGGPIAAA